MERRSSDQRIEVHRRLKRDHRVYVELYWNGGNYQSKCDRDCDRQQQRDGDVNLGPAHQEYRRNTGNALTGYHIYYGTSESDLTQSIVVSGASTASYEITGLSSGTWYFSVAAMAADGTESAPSNVGSKTI